MRAPDGLTVVTAAPPTPNGDLHLGHVSGPYLGADILARAQRLSGRAAYAVTGSDLHQSYTRTKAAAQGVDPYLMAAGYADDIDDVFRSVGIDLAACVRPQDAPRHGELVAEFFTTLYERGCLVERERPTLHCPRCDRYLFEALVSGGCPRCGADSDGNSCEACAWPNVGTDLDAATCTVCGTTATTRTTRQLYFPLARYAGLLAGRLGETWCGVAVDALRRQLLTSPLPEIPVTHPTDWGLPVPVPGYEDQRVYVWFEMLPGYFAEIEEMLRHAGIAGNWRSVWDAPSTEVVQFFGFDNGYFHSVLHPCLLLAYDESIRLPRALVANEFLQLDGTKFSTSRGHAVWARELVEQIGPDATRFALAWLRPEVGPVSFTWAALARIVDGELAGTWTPWLDGLGDRVAAVRRTGPGDGPDLADHATRFLGQLDRLTQDTVRAYSWSSFSPQQAVRLLSELVRLAGDFRRSFARVEDGIPHPACVAAELTAARRLAALSAPVMPRFACRLWAALGEPGEPNLQAPPGTAVPAAVSLRGYFTPTGPDRVGADGTP